MIELNEFVMETDDLEAVKKEQSVAEAKMQSYQEAFNRAFLANDYDAAKEVVKEMKYYSRLLDNINRRFGFGK